jgi:predicted metal-dependent HD superfamily phosphohydrolase
VATRHDNSVQGRDAALVVDIDLAILGSPSERFEAYDRDIRKEYAWVSGFRYRSQRRHVLQGFLSRARIYETACAAELLEEQARINLQAAIERLEQ